MLITFLGSCSGTEPMPDRHHTSFVVEENGGLYWFDAGEGCAYTGHLAGVDLPLIEALFISHTHIDHTGGLANLIWTLKKLTKMPGRALDRLSGRSIPIFIPDLEVWEAVRRIAAGPEPEFDPPFRLSAGSYKDGLIFDAKGVKVLARHNGHLGDSPPYRSFSFRIETDSKSVVYSGDVKSIEDIEPFLGGCDVLLMETGHHDVEEVCRWLGASDKTPGRLVFVHHGRAILSDPAGELAKARDILGDIVTIAEDKMKIEI